MKHTAKNIRRVNEIKINTRRRVPLVLPSLADYSSRQEWEDVCWQKILGSKSILESVITSYERHNLIMRATVLDRITSGKRSGQIAEELWLSPQTISGIKKALSENNYRSYRERGKTERKKRMYTSASAAKKRRRGRPVRTKYGKVYL